MKPESEKHVAINESDKRRIIQWEIPHFIQLLEREYKVSFAHIITPDYFYKAAFLETKEQFTLERKIIFPFFIGKKFFGVLVCFDPLNYKQRGHISTCINQWLEKIYLKYALNKKHNMKDLKDISSFPLLLKKDKKEDLLKTAHELYLNTSSFAFLNSEDMQWKENCFRKMRGVFVCIPSFHQLSDSQKEILTQDLKSKKLKCRLVMGVRQKEKPLPPLLKKLFSSTLP